MATDTHSHQVTLIIAAKLRLWCDVIYLRSLCHAAHLAQMIIAPEYPHPLLCPLITVTLRVPIALMPVVSAFISLVVGVCLASATTISESTASGMGTGSWRCSRHKKTCYRYPVQGFVSG